MKETQNTVQNANMAVWNQVCTVPQDALKEIEGGPLKGKSNINPIWRLRMLTHLFGPCGFGWKIEQTKSWESKTASGDTAVFVEIKLYVKMNGEWSAPIEGQGGNILIRNSVKWENSKQVTIQTIDDDAYKKAYTDAISVACKALGFAADILYQQEETKYGTFQNIGTPAPIPVQQAQWPWNPTLKELTPKSASWNASITQACKLKELNNDALLQRISEKFNITSENFNALLLASGRVTNNTRVS